MLSPAIRQVIKNMSKNGHPIKFIVKIVGHSRNAVRSALKNPVDVKPKPRPTKLSARDKRSILRVANSGIHTAAGIKETLGLDCSVGTVLNAMKELGIRSMINRSKKPKKGAKKKTPIVKTWMKVEPRKRIKAKTSKN